MVDYQLTFSQFTEDNKHAQPKTNLLSVAGSLQTASAERKIFSHVFREGSTTSL
jgi:hypothetical protein